MNGDSSLSYSWAEAHDLDEVEAFLVTGFGADSLQAIPGRARWLFWDNPFGLHVALCRDGDELVGMCGHLPYPLAGDGGEVMAAFGIDMMVLPNWRGRGIGSRFLEMRLQRFDLSLSSGQSQGMGALYRKAGAVELGTFVLARARRAWPRQRHLRALVRDTLAWLKPRLAAGGVQSQHGAKRERILECDAADWLSGDTCETRSDRAGTGWSRWLRWRFFGPLYNDHSCWLVTTKGCRTGLVVTRRDGDVEHVVDMFAPSGHEASVLAAAAITSPAPEIHVIAAGGRLGSWLSRQGFLVRPRDAVLIAHGAADILDLSRFSVLSGPSDTDLLRRVQAVR